MGLRSIRFPLLCLLGASLLVAQDPGPSDAVIKVPGRAMTRAEFEAFSAGAGVDPSSDRAVMLSRVRSWLVLSAEARRLGLDSDPAVKARIDFAVAQVLSKEIFQRFLAEARKDEAAVRAYYDTHQSPAEQREISHILVRAKGSRKPLRAGQRELAEAEAKAKADALLAKWKAGADFAALARAESDDPESAAKGGDIGLQSRGTLLDQFGLRAFELKVDDKSEPVKTADGWHIIWVRRVALPPFEAVRRSIENDMARERMDKLIATGAELNPAYFGAAAK